MIPNISPESLNQIGVIYHDENPWHLALRLAVISTVLRKIQLLGNPTFPRWWRHHRRYMGQNLKLVSVKLHTPKHQITIANQTRGAVTLTKVLTYWVLVWKVFCKLQLEITRILNEKNHFNMFGQFFLFSYNS